MTMPTHIDPAAHAFTSEDVIASQNGTLSRERKALLDPDKGYAAAFVLADLIRQEAINRDWCSEYEDFAANVNANVGFALMEPRRRTFVVHASVEVSNGVSFNEVMDAISEHLGRVYDADVSQL